MTRLPIDFYAKGYLERYTRLSSRGYKSRGYKRGYKHVRDGTLKELIEYAWAHNRGQLDIYGITVGTDQYVGQAIKDLFHNHNFPKRSKRTRSPSQLLKLAVTKWRNWRYLVCYWTEEAAKAGRFDLSQGRKPLFALSWPYRHRDVTWHAQGRKGSIYTQKQDLHGNAAPKEPQ